VCLFSIEDVWQDVLQPHNAKLCGACVGAPCMQVAVISSIADLHAYLSTAPLLPGPVLSPVLQPDVQGKVITGLLPDAVSHIIIPSSMHLRLEGCTIRLPPGVAIVVQRQAKLVMQDVTLYGCLEVEGTVSLQCCRVTNQTRRQQGSAAALHTREGVQATIFGCKLSSHGPGLLVEHSGTFVLARSTRFQHCGSHGASVTKGAMLCSIACTFSDNNNGGGLSARDPGSRLDVEHCTAEGNAGHGLAVLQGAHMMGAAVCIAVGNLEDGFHASGQASKMVLRGKAWAIRNGRQGFSWEAGAGESCLHEQVDTIPGRGARASMIPTAAHTDQHPGLLGRLSTHPLDGMLSRQLQPR
jgi:hypothetical protein